jgi:hypothetical protein
MGGVIPYARMRPNVTNYVVGGTSVDNTGGVIGGSSPTGPSTWGTGTPSAAASFVLSSGANFAYQAYVIQPAVASSTPTLGRAKIDEIHGNICVAGFVNPGRVSVSVCIYVSELNSNSGKWDVRDPMTATDAARDDYFYLESQTMEVFSIGLASSFSLFRFDLRLANPLVIGGGQAVHVGVSYVNSAGGACNICSAFRTRVGPIA